MYPRVGVGAIIIYEGRLAAVKKHDKHGVFYNLLGGSQERGETLVQAVPRDIYEETGGVVHMHQLDRIRLLPR